MGPGIGRDALDPGKTGFDLIKDNDKIRGLENQAVGILKKNGMHAVLHPGDGRMKGLHISGLCLVKEHRKLTAGDHVAFLGGPEPIHMTGYGLDVLYDVVDGSQCK